ncbi:MAG: elongation factor P [Malacoplasma sp.]|nr:elongation factor P [Malacoplasma sp.]
MSQIIHAKDLRPGNTFIFKNNLYLVIENSFNKTAMREGIVKCKVKNLRTSSITTEVLTGEKLERAIVDKIKAIFSYEDKNNLVFMDSETFEQIEIEANKLKWEKKFIVDGSEVNILKFGEEVLNVSLPDQVSLKVDFAEEAVQGNTVQAAMKKAKLETGLELDVPQFIKTGDKVIVNTSSGQYIGRDK